MDHCPSRSELEDFLNDRLPADGEGRVLAHLDGCSACQRALEGLTAGSVGETARSRFDAARTARAEGSGDGPVNPLPSRTDAARSRPSRLLTTCASSAGSTTLPLGAGLADHPDYAIVRELGAGGMGVVYLARNRLLERDDVLKVIVPDILSNPGTLDRFLREMRAVARLRHPNIVSAYTAFRWGGKLVFVMEYVEGLDLRRLVESKGPMPVGHACSFVQQAATALQHAFEEGMVHRDIKPGNLMLTHRKNRAVIKVLDFGLAKATSEQDADELGFEVAAVEAEIGQGLTRTGQMLGTPAYIAPEQIADSRSADTRADIYSLGCTLYYLLSGRLPFRGATLYETLRAQQSAEAPRLNRVRPDVPAGLAAVVARMMEKSPDRRFQEPAEVAEALAPFFKKRSPSAGTLPLGDPGVARHDRGLVAGGAIRPESMGASASPAGPGVDRGPPPLPIPLAEVPPRISEMVAPVVAPAPRQKKRKKRPIDREFHVSMGIGSALAVVALNVPLIGMVIGCLATVVHELGHTATSWLFGLPAVPAFDLTYGGGFTRCVDRQPALLVGVYAIFAYLLYLARGDRPKLVMGAVAVVLYSVAAFTPLHGMIVAAMGHGAELLVAGIFLFRALSGSQVLRGEERPLYACLGLCMLYGCSRSAFELTTSEAHRVAYHVARGDQVMDFDVIADEYLRWPLERVAGLYLLACVLTPVAAFLAYRFVKSRECRRPGHPGPSRATSRLDSSIGAA